MKRYIRSDDFVFPNTIQIEVYPNNWITYTKMYEHENGGCYYQTTEDNDPITSVFVSLYPDGRLTYIWYPGKIFYVQYDDIMNPASDIKWVNGQPYYTYDEALDASRSQNLI